MMRSVCGVTIALLPLLSGQRPDASAAAEENITIPLTPEGLPMADLIKQASQVLGYTIYFEPGELQNDRLSATGPQIVPRSEFLALLHNVLRSRDLVLITLGRGESAQHVIRRISGQNTKPGMLKSLAQVVTPEDLLSNKSLGSALVTTQVSLKNVDARETATTLTTYFADTMVESVRNIENTNSLMMTGYASTLRGMLQLIDMVDRPPTVDSLPFSLSPNQTAGSPAKPIEARLRDHEEHIAKLERLVIELAEQLKAKEKR